MLKILHQYRLGMATYDRCHPPTIQSQWSAFKAELKEFVADPSLEEAWDILHSFGRFVWRVTGIPLHWIAYPTVRKHGQRFIKICCIRSQRNCEGCCLKNLLIECHQSQSVQGE